MEQWNNEQESSNDVFSLRRVLELKYLYLVMKKQRLDIKDIKPIKLQDAIAYAESHDNSSEANSNKAIMIPDKEGYIASQSYALFKILNTIIPDCKKKLHNVNGREFCFNLENANFISNLLYAYDNGDDDCHALRDGYFNVIGKDFLKFFHEGLVGLAENRATILQIEEVNREWNLRFNSILDKMLDKKDSILSIMASLYVNINYYVSRVTPANEKLIVLENIQDKLKLCSTEIENAISDNKLEITSSEVEDQLAYFTKSYVEKIKRIERAIKGKETRDRNNRKTE